MEMPFPDDWDGESFCKWAICWPDSIKWQAILSGLVELPVAGRFWDFSTGNFLSTRAAFQPAYMYNFTLKECYMACDDTGLLEVAQSLAAIASAIATSNATATASGDCGCQGTNGAGQYETPISDVIEGNPSTDPPPEGFGSWEEFFNQKCAVAKSIVDNLKITLGNLSFVAFGAITFADLVAAAAVAITLTISSAGIVAIIGLVLAVGSVIVITTILSIINDNEAEFVCALFGGNSAQDSRQMFLDVFGEYADAGIADPIENNAAKAIVSYLMSNEEVNRLYVKDATKVYPTADCDCPDDCIFGQWGEMEFGTITDGSFLTCGITAVSEHISGPENRIDVSFWEDDTMMTRIEVLVNDFASSPSPLSQMVSGPNVYRFYDASLSLVYNSNTPPTAPITNVAAMSIVASNSGFHIDLGFEE